MQPGTRRLMSRGAFPTAAMNTHPSPQEESDQSPSQQPAGKTRPNGPPAKKARRTALTRNACQRCRQAKAKCNGKHPTCSRCHASNDRCVYDVEEEGVTRMQNMTQKLAAKTIELECAMGVLDALRGGTDHDAAATLAQLRLGDSLAKITADLPKRDSSPPSSGGETGWSSSSNGMRTDTTDTSATSYTDSNHSWPSSPATTDPNSYAFGLHATVGNPALAQHFSMGSVRARLAATHGLPQRAMPAVGVNPFPNVTPHYDSHKFARRYSQPQHQFTAMGQPLPMTAPLHYTEER